MLEFLHLKAIDPLTKGSTRLVYAHPSDPGLLVKVMRSDFLAARRAATAWHHRFKPTRMLSIFVREVREQLVLISRGEDPKRLIAPVVGFCETDLGVGMVVAAVRGVDGELAPTLSTLLRADRLDEATRADLFRFLDLLIQSTITIGQLAPGNLVYGIDVERRPRFALIDGYGEGALFPWKGAFPSLNRLKKKRLIGQLRRKVERHPAFASRAVSSRPGPMSSRYRNGA